MNVYTTFEWLKEDRTYAEWVVDAFDIVPIQMCLHVEYTPPVEEIECCLCDGNEQRQRDVDSDSRCFTESTQCEITVGEVE